MNDPSKMINVNLSSLLSLKAELLRKQAEVSKAKFAQSSSSVKAQEYVSINAHKQPESMDDDINTSHRKRDKKKRAKEVDKTPDATVYEHEDTLMLQKSQKVLEAKAKFYERMTKTGGKLNSDDNCLVMFNRKKQEEQTDEQTNGKQYRDTSDTSDVSSSDEDNMSDQAEDHPDDDWVEYTDCLGRTRKCLKEDFEEAKRKDNELAASMPERLDQTKANWMIDIVGCKATSGDDEDNELIGPMPASSVFADGLSMMSKHEEQKANWERKEQENLEKQDVHYQDVFFDEARQHGVGYYAFSTDDKERKKQQKELEKERQKTLEEQQRRESQRAQREKIIAERVLAAKNRQRARLGLPPLEREEEKNSVDEKPKETKEEKKARKKAEKLERKRQKEEEEREMERQSHIRPWDEEKDGVQMKRKLAEGETEEEWHYKPEREPMSQEQWNEMKRNERAAEFAPMPEIPLKRTNFKSAPHTSYQNVPPPSAAYEDPYTFSTFQSTRRNEKIFKRKNYENSQDEDMPPPTRLGACIPPPANLEDFHLPSHSKRSKTSHEVENSIEAGLRFIRNNCDKQIPATKQSWTAKADY